MTGQTLHQPLWRLERRTVTVRGQARSMRLVAFQRGWLASIDTESGPTLAADRSPYLAAWRALEPLGVDFAVAVTLVGRMPR